MNNRLNVSEILGASSVGVETLSSFADMKAQGGILKGQDCFFPVETRKAQIVGFSDVFAPGIFVVNPETETVLGRYEKAGSLVENFALVQLFEAGLTEAGYLFTVDYTCFDAGSRFEADYELTAVRLEDPDGKPVSLHLTLRNSYNGQWSITLGRKTVRLVCLNGMEAMKMAIALTQKHSSKVDVSRIRFGVETVVSGAAEEMEQLKRMIGYSLSPAQEMAFLGNAVAHGKGAISRRLATRIAVEARLGDETDPERGTLWSLYNVGTRVLRDMREVRPDQASKANRMWTNLCVLSANPDLSSYARGAFEKMVSPVKNPNHRIIDID